MMASFGGARPGNVPPPNYDPNALANNMQNLQINRPNQAPVSGGLRPPSSFSQQPPPFPGAPPASRPGPPPPGAFPRGAFPPGGPQQSTFPPNYASNRPAGAPTGAQPPPQPYASRPPPRVLSPFMAGVSGVPPPPGNLPSSGFGSRPAAPSIFAQFGSNPVMPLSRTSGPVSNGPPTVGPEQVAGAPRFPPVGGMPQPSVSGPTQAMYPSFGSPPAAHTMSQPNQPFSVATQNMQPSSPSHFSAQVPGMRPPSDSSFGSQPWQMPPRQVGPPSIHGYVPQPRTVGMPPPHQSMAAIPPVGHTGAALAGPTKIDPNQIPRPFPSSAISQHETHQGNQVSPPLPDMQSSYMRCTINQIPCTNDLLNTSGMQLALLVQPLALPHPSEDPIQVVDFGESGPVRCSRCKGYINPFMKFVDQGRRFICNLCGYNDETPRDYHCNLGPDGRRRDAHERPELCQGTVEFVATKEYMVRDPMPTVYFFLIDVSMNAIKTGATAAACSAITQVIADLPEGPRTMVGVATFDSTIHFYNLKRDLQQPLMLIVPDIQDVYTPLESDAIVQLSEYRQHVELLLETIPRMFNNPRTADSAFGAAVKAAFLAMKSTGGKLLVFQSVLPSVGLGALSAREAEGRTNISAGEKEANKLLQPTDKTLKALALEFAEYQVCVDVFLTTQTYVDIASISVIPRTTGGRVYYYYPFSALSDNAKLYNDLRWNVTRPQGFEAVMRVRCSQGLQVQEYHGNFCKRIPTDVDLPAIDCDKTIMVTLKHDDKFQDGAECDFQCALLYTTVYGERRIRVSTISLPCTSTLSNLFRSADLDTQFACMLKQAANDIPSLPLSQVRELATNFCINILTSYRKFCATVTSSGQLILPEALKLLPLYTLAMVKSTGLRTDGRADDRSYWINYISQLSTSLAIPLVYPRLISIHDLDSQESESSLPEFLPLSSEHVSDNGIYLLENGEDCLIYIGSLADPYIIKQLLGISSVEEMPEQFVLQQYDNPLSKKLNDIINEIRRQRCSFLKLRLCKKGEPSGMTFFSYFVEDKTPLGLSYVEFLVHVHRQIQNKMQ